MLHRRFANATQVSLVLNQLVEIEEHEIRTE